MPILLERDQPGLLIKLDVMLKYFKEYVNKTNVYLKLIQIYHVITSDFDMGNKITDFGKVY